MPDTGAVARSAGIQPDPDFAAGLGVTSDYFRARAIIDLDDIQFVYTSELQRRAGVRVFKRDQGGS